MNLTERAEIRKETFYKLTNSRDVPEAPSVGGRNLFKGSRDFSGSWVNGGSGVYAEDHQGVKMFKKNSMWGGLSQYFEVKTGEEYVFSSYVKSSAKTDRVTFYLVHSNKQPQAGGVVSFDSADGRDAVSFDLTDKYKRIAIKIKITKDGWIMPRLERYNTDAYLFFGGYKFEKGSESTPYSQAPEDFGWSTTAPVPTPTQRYLWKFEYIYYSDGSVENTQPVNISIAGADGTNGQTSHVHFAFADNATGGGFSLTTPKAYMGWYADFNETASNDPTKYRWSKWKGDEGAPGKPGADGKTSYFHMAYADSADGRTGFSFKESGQQYQGYYTDFTQSSSTDPTKYTWMDRRAGIEVDFRNLLSKTNRGKTNWSWTISSGGTTPEDYNVDGINAVKLTRTSDASFSWDYIQYQGLLRNLIEPNTKYTLSFDIKPSVDVTFTASLRRGDSGAPLTNSTTMNKATANQWNKVSCVLTSKTTLPDDLSQVVYLQGMPVAKGNYLIIKNIKLGKGNVPTPWLPALEDVQDDIDSKADQALTQEQLNALAEKNSIIKAEMEAKASIDTVNQWITAYQNYVNANDEARAESEKNLQEAAARILQLKTDVGALRQQWDFIDTYMSIQNEGLIIGKSDGSAFAKFANDRISLFSGSSEVMYISQGTLHIENGIFTKTIQIGRFRFETHPADKDMLVLRYLGG